MLKMLSIDRFEGEYAVCVDDDENIVSIDRKLIRGKAVSGDVIDEKDGVYIVLENETERRKKENKEASGRVVSINFTPNERECI